MFGSTHIAMTKAVVEALGWPGDRNLVARNAAWPDEARVIEVEKYGAHVIGRNLASLTHFTRPIGKGKFGGYCWKSDASVPRIDLSTVKVIPRPEAWGDWAKNDPEILAAEPFAKLVRDLTGHATIQADEITYSTSANMAQWAYEAYVKVAGAKPRGAGAQAVLDILAGVQYHLAAQDPSVPHHGACVLLDGHSAFEGDVDECYKRMEGSGEIAALLKTLIVANNAPKDLTPRLLAEDVAKRAYVSPKRLGWSRCFWRAGWNKLVRACVLRGLTSSVQLGKVLLRAAA